MTHDWTMAVCIPALFLFCVTLLSRNLGRKPDSLSEKAVLVVAHIFKVPDIVSRDNKAVAVSYTAQTSRIFFETFHLPRLSVHAKVLYYVRLTKPFWIRSTGRPGFVLRISLTILALMSSPGKHE